MRYVVLLLAVLALPSVASAADIAVPKTMSAFAGRYGAHFKNGDVTGDVYWSDDVVEIVPLNDMAAYVRADLQFFNGHQCSISGMGRLEGEALVYHDTSTPLPDQPVCVLRFERKDGQLVLDDGARSCGTYCGARGALGGTKLSLSSQRPIHYLPRLRASPEYRSALKAWSGSPYNPEARPTP